MASVTVPEVVCGHAEWQRLRHALEDAATFYLINAKQAPAIATKEMWDRKERETVALIRKLRTTNTIRFDLGAD